MASKITFDDKSHIIPYGTHETQVWDTDINEIKTVVNTNADELDITVSKVDNLETNQVDGFVRYNTLADLNAIPTKSTTTRYVVDSDATATNNGTYKWTGSAFVKIADVYENTVVSTNITKGVTGKAVVDYVSDYNSLGDDVLKQINHLSYIIPNSNWEIGTIASATGIDASSTIRIRSKLKRIAKKSTIVILSDKINYKYSFYIYNIVTGYFVSATGFITSDYVVPQDCNYRIVLSKSNDSTIVSTSELFDKISIKNEELTDNTVTVEKLSDNLKYATNGLSYNIDFKFWEFGSITTGGINATPSNDKIRTTIYTPVPKDMVIGLSDYSLYRYNVFLYTKSNVYISTTGFITSDYTIPQDCNVRVAVAYIDNHLFYSISELSNLLTFKKREVESLSVGYKQLKTNISDKLTGFPISFESNLWEIGTITSLGVNSASTNKIRTIDYFKVAKGQTIGLSDYSLYRFYFCRYSIIDKSFVEYVPTRVIDYIMPEDCYIRVLVAFNDSRDITNVSLISGLFGVNYIHLPNYWDALPITTESRLKEKFGENGNQGMGLVKNEIWHFNYSDVEVSPGVYDHHTYPANVVRRDINTLQLLPPITHNLGHASSVDYSLVNDCVLVGNGTWDNTVLARIDLVLNASSYINQTTKNIVYGSPDVISIPLFNGNKSLGKQTVACWGEDKRIIYVITGGDLPTKIHRIFLGTGTNDFSDVSVGQDDITKFGTFIAGKGVDEFNGTCKVLSVHTSITADSQQAYRQGIQFYMGEIWLLSGWNKQQVIKIKCMNDGTYRVSEMIEIQQYNGDGTKWTDEPQGMFIDYPYAYIYLKGSKKKCYAVPIHNLQKGVGVIGVKTLYDFPVNHFPNIKTTPLSDVIDLYISSYDSLGFTVLSKTGGSGTYNWDANC